MCYVTQDVKALIRKRSAATPVSKRGSATFSATSSHLCLSSLSTLWHVIFFYNNGLKFGAVRPFALIEFTRAFIQIKCSPPLLKSLFWQFVELTSVKELNSTEVTRFCQATLRVLKVSLLKKLCLWPCLKVTLNLRKREPHTHKTHREKFLTKVFLFSWSRK